MVGIDTQTGRYSLVRLAAGILLGATIAVGGFSGTALAGDHRDHHRDWHHDWGGGYYRAPPVVYGSPYGYAPPVVYGPGFGLNINIR